MGVIENIDQISLSNLPSLPPDHIRFYLCRHGQTDFNKSLSIQGRGINSSLNSTGQQQANCIGKCFQNILLDLICSSSLNRAIETSNSIRSYHSNIEYMKLSDLDEMSFGSLEGKSLKKDGDGYVELQQIMDKWKQGNFSTQFQDGESPVDVYTRGVKGLQSIISNTSSDKNSILIVAHGRFLKILLSYILYDDLGKMSDLEQGNCCINVIDYSRVSKKFTPVILNFTGHIPDELTL